MLDRFLNFRLLVGMCRFYRVGGDVSNGYLGSGIVDFRSRDDLFDINILLELDLGFFSVILLFCDRFVLVNLSVIVLNGLYVYNY